MKYIHLGWLRLWIVLTIIVVPVMAELQFREMQSTWDHLDKMAVHHCVDEEFESNFKVDSLNCLKKDGAFKVIFERENTTAARWWAGALGISLIFDIIITISVVIFYQAVRWIIRGFSAERQ